MGPACYGAPIFPGLFPRKEDVSVDEGSYLPPSAAKPTSYPVLAVVGGVLLVVAAFAIAGGRR